MITQKDIDELEKTFVTKDDLKSAFSDLKSDLFEKIDPVLKEVSTNREERTILEHRITKLENAIKTN